MASILERKESLLQEADRLERERFRRQIALLQDYYQKDEVRNKVKEVFSALLGKWNRQEEAFSLGITCTRTCIIEPMITGWCFMEKPSTWRKEP